VLLGALHLRADHQEVQHDEHQDDRQEADDLLFGRATAAWA
jgi:hypothetical protein